MMHGVEWLWLIVLMPAGLLFGFGLRSLLAVRSMVGGPAAGSGASRGPGPGCAGCTVGNCSRSAADRCEEPAQGTSPVPARGSMPR